MQQAGEGRCIWQANDTSERMVRGKESEVIRHVMATVCSKQAKDGVIGKRTKIAIGWTGQSERVGSPCNGYRIQQAGRGIGHANEKSDWVEGAKGAI